MSGKQSLVEEAVQERLDDAFARSKTFGRLRWLTDETLLAMVLAVIIAALAIVFFLIGGEVIGPSSEKYAQLNISVQEVILGDSSGPATEVTDPVTPQTIKRKSRSGQVPGLDPAAQVETGEGRDLTGEDLDVAEQFQEIDNIPEIQLPPAAPGGGSPGSSSAVGIFAVDKSVKSVVYIVDKSGSMAGNNLRRVKVELIFAIDRLDESQTFSVVFFDGLAWAIFTQRGVAATGSATNLKVLKATAGNKTLAKDWIESIYSGGGTNPYPAVLMGLGTKPEKMFILSDGEFSPTYVNDITAHNSNRASIDCYGFGETIRTLIDIADQNNGVYKTVR